MGSGKYEAAVGVMETQSDSLPREECDSLCGGREGFAFAMMLNLINPSLHPPEGGNRTCPPSRSQIPNTRKAAYRGFFVS
jgi:hypothetical protein